MKKLFTVLSVVALGFTSCGEASGEASGDEKKAEGNSQKAVPSAVCDCIDSRLNMMKDVMNGMSEEDAELKYAEDKKACMAMGEGKTPEEMDVLNKEWEECASSKEFEKIEKEFMEKMRSELMMEQGLDAAPDGDVVVSNICDCLKAAQSEKEAMACSPGKSLDDLKSMMMDCLEQDGADMNMDEDMDMPEMDMPEMDMDMDMDMDMEMPEMPEMPKK